MFGSCCKKDNTESQYELLSQEEQQKKVDQELNNKYYKQLQQSEKQLLESVGFKIGENLEIQNVFLDEEKTTWIHTYICGDIKQLEDKNKIKNSLPYVLVHGYGHTGMCFFQILQELSKEKLVFGIDIIGMGLSQRPEFNYKTPESILDYFSSSFEKWRINSNLQKFILIGHSIGGYLSANYAMRYPDNIKSLHLISPIGGTTGTDQENIEYEQYRVSNMSFSFKALYKCLIKPSWQDELTTESLSKKFYFPTTYVVNKYVKNRCKLEGRQFEIYKDLMLSSFQLKVSTTTCLHRLFRFPKLSPYLSLQENLPIKLPKTPIHFYYGDNDWMNSKGIQQLNEQKLINMTYSVISNAGHNVQFDNGQELVQKIKQNDGQLMQKL